jgi:hypothetical protein
MGKAAARAAKPVEAPPPVVEAVPELPPPGEAPPVEAPPVEVVAAAAEKPKGRRR